MRWPEGPPGDTGVSWGFEEVLGDEVLRADTGDLVDWSMVSRINGGAGSVSSTAHGASGGGDIGNMAMIL